uniref:Zinc finger protein 227-like n=1 Tax=Diabrotica virgifera virgifera TaxID=50390 RepID=A0A6P7FWG2_DIAVI
MDVKEEPVDTFFKENFTISENELIQSLNTKEEEDTISNNKMHLQEIKNIKVELDDQPFKTDITEDFFENCITVMNGSDVHNHHLNLDTKSEILSENFYVPSIKTEIDIPDFIGTQPSCSKPYKDVKYNIKLVKKSIHECPVCLKRFPSLWKRNKHFNIHFDWRTSQKKKKGFNLRLRSNIVTCNHCGKLFTQRKDFLLHMINYTTNGVATSKEMLIPGVTDSSLTNSAELKPFRCEICLKQFSRKNHLSCHMQRHDLKEMFECEICFKKFIYKYNLTYHMRYHTGENLFTCTICYKSFSRQDRLNQHMPLHSEERLFKVKKVYKCEICPKQFVVKHNLMLHMRFHIGYKPYKCEICLKNYVSHSRLMLHKRCHAAERPYKCDVCSKQFIEKAGLTRHMHSHTGEKPFKCEICSKGFQRNYYLNSHMLSHTGERPYKCDICLKFFRDKSNLNRHMLCHTGKKSFKCDICDKLFRDGTGLSRHKRCHSGEKPFKCDVCSRPFREKCALTRHVMSHTGEKPYECQVCSKRFRQTGTLQKHLRTHNKKPKSNKKKVKSNTPISKRAVQEP